jgi:hypothetical protein
MAQSRDWSEEILQKGQALGAVREDMPLDLLAEATTGLMVGVDRWFAEALAHESMDELAPLVPKTLAMTRDLLEPREEETRR